MLQVGEDLSFAQETAVQIVPRRPVTNNLQRDLLLRLAVRSFREVDGSHAAAAELAHDPVRSHGSAGPGLFCAWAAVFSKEDKRAAAGVSKGSSALASATRQ